MSEAFHTPLSSHLFMETSAHLLAAASNGLILEHMAWWGELFEERLTLEDGHVLLAERPGIGFSLDRKVLDRVRV